jgi:hypothetical protein
LSEGRSPERLFGAAACGRDLMAKPAALLVIGALLAALAACGSADSGAKARDQVEATVRHSLLHDDPAFCATGTTPRFLNQIYGDSENPLQQCKFEAVLPGEPTAREVRFESVRVEGGTAETTAAVTGGADDGSVLRIELVKDGGRWRFDRLADIEIDRARSDAASLRDLRDYYGVTEKEAACAVARVRRFFDTDQLERAILEGQTEAFAAAQAVCFDRRTLVRLFDLGFQKAAPKDLPEPLVDCVSHRITAGASTALLRAMFVSPDELDAFSERATAAAVKACAKDAEAGLIPEPAPT